jgi:LDH2 family malate/lactate/ureidoglycolate dehydrogenase
MSGDNIERIAGARLEGWSAALLVAAGVPSEDAAEVARHLVFADARGISSHGVGRLKAYVARIEAGSLVPRGQPRIVSESPVSALIDGGNTFGQLAGRLAVDVALAKAGSTGVGMVGVRESNHSGCLGYYTRMIAEAGCLGFTCSNGAAFMLPYGGREPYFSSAPISFAAPVEGGPPLVLDMATSQAAFGKIISASREGRQIPEGWAVTRDGQPTTDSRAALDGYLLPAGGAKGSALALMVEVLAGVLPMAMLSPSIPPLWTVDKPQRSGQFFLALRTDLFGSEASFRSTLDDVVRRLRRGTAADGFTHVSAPGDLELANEEESSRLGIAVSTNLLEELATLGERYGVELVLD